MKKYLIVLAAIFIMAPCAYAQVVIDSPTTGIVGYYWSNTYSTSGSLYIAGQSNFLDIQGVMEFDLSGLPTEDMTASNWSAHLNSIGVTSTAGYMAAPSSDTMFVDIFDLADNSEDGEITLADFDNTLGGSIARRTHVFPATVAPDAVNDNPDDGVANFTNIDVTEALRRDLFGDGAGDDTTGFILAATPQTRGGRIWYDESAPNITITVDSEYSNDPNPGSDNDCFINTVTEK